MITLNKEEVAALDLLIQIKTAYSQSIDDTLEYLSKKLATELRNERKKSKNGK